MATIKVACPKCGQKVSGDESFYGTVVECPICSANIPFPGEKKEQAPKYRPVPVPPDDPPLPSDFGSEAPPKAEQLTEQLPVRIDAETAIPLDASSQISGGDEVPSPIFGAISMVSSILAIVTCVGGPLFAPIAIITGHMALARARHSIVQPAPGQTLGAIGLIVGYASLFITILFLAALAFFGDSILGPIREYFQNAEN